VAFFPGFSEYSHFLGLKRVLSPCTVKFRLGLEISRDFPGHKKDTSENAYERFGRNMFYKRRIAIKRPLRGNKKEKGKKCILVITEAGRIRELYVEQSLS
jgi:hypothetical protein